MIEPIGYVQFFTNRLIDSPHWPHDIVGMKPRLKRQKSLVVYCRKWKHKLHSNYFCNHNYFFLEITSALEKIIQMHIPLHKTNG